MDTKENRERLKAEKEKNKAKQTLLLEYLLDPFITYDEADKLSRLGISCPSESYPTNQRVIPSNHTARLVG